MKATCAATVLAAALAAGSVSAQAPAAPAPTFDHKAWLEDYAYLKVQLEAHYSNLAWFASPAGGVDLPTLDRRTLAALNAADSDAGARVVIHDFVAGFHDGHFSELPPQESPPPGAKVAPEPPPRNLRADDADKGCAALGYANRSLESFSLPFEALDGFVLESDGQATGFRAGTITVAARKLGVARIRSFQPKQYPDACRRAWRAHPAMSKTSDDFDDAVQDAWLDALATQLKRFHSEGVDAVIVDVGNNGGGNDSGDWSPRLLTAKPVHSAPMLLSTDGVVDAYLKEEFDGLDKAAKTNPTPAEMALIAEARAKFEALKADLPKRACDMGWVWREQRPFDPLGCSRLIAAGYGAGANSYVAPDRYSSRKVAESFYWAAAVDPWRGAWNGPAYALIDARSYSSAEMFAAVAQDNHVAKLVGVRTGGDGCGFVEEVPPAVLPHSNMRFRMPNCVRLRADGTSEVMGISPDIALPALNGESARARAYKALTLIVDDMKAK